MKLLASRNIVNIRQGSGTYIANSPGMVADPLGFTFIADKQKLAQDLLEIRFLLEPPIAARAALRATEHDIHKIQTLCQEVEDLLRSGKDHTQKDIEFHTAIAMEQPEYGNSTSSPYYQQCHPTVYPDYRECAAGRDYPCPS